MSNKLPPRILVIESDEVMNTSISNTIERYWFDVVKSYSIEEGLKVTALNAPNVIVIGNTKSETHMSAIVAQIRAIYNLSATPIVFLINGERTVLNEQPKDNLHLVEVIQRPFTPHELMTIVKSLLRRSQPIFQDKIIEHKDIKMDLATYKVSRSDKSIRLGPTEFKILQLFIQSPRTVYSRQQIINHVWGADKVIEHRTVDVHVNRLRNLMKLDKNEMPLIKTIRASGYCLNLPGEID